MTIRAPAFTPEVMLTMPRRSPGLPNHDGTLVLYSESVHSFKTHETTSQIRVLDIKTGSSFIVDNNSKSSSPVWLEGNTVALLRSTDKSATEIIVGKVTDFKKSCHLAGTVNAPAANLRVCKISKGHYGLAFTAAANPDGSLHIPKDNDNKKSTGKLYRSLFVRHWDRYVQPQRSAIFYTALYNIKSSCEDNDDDYDDVSSYKISNLTNLLKGTSLESPIPPFGGKSDFDISPTGIVFIARDPNLSPATNTKCNIYIAHLKSYLETSTTLFNIDMGDVKGAMASPVFSKDGNQVAFLAMRENGYEADKNQVFIVPNTKEPGSVIPLLTTDDGKVKWELSPSSIRWSHDSSTLFVTADFFGRSRIFHFPRYGKADNPTEVEIEGSVTDVRPLPENHLFVTATGFVESCSYYLVTLDSAKTHCKLLASASHLGSSSGLSRSQVDEFWFIGAGENSFTDDKVHALVVKPSHFSPSEKYPVAFLVHGGPQASWNDSWSTRWNIALWAEAGYIAVCPNPTGSTGYGQNFVDAIQEQWGGRTYQDLERCFEYVEKHLDYADTSRAVGLGASFGGFSMNWIQGQPLGKKLKALVTHDGVFSMRFALATDELYFVNHDFGGPWTQKNHEKWAKWDPSLCTDTWTTPHLIIHSSLDFRLSEAEGLAAFNVLQSKGIDSQYLMFPDENHWVQKPENSLVWHEVVFAWINRHVGLPYKEVEDGIVQDPPRPVDLDGEERVKLVK